jgi:hypothetical protein
MIKVVPDIDVYGTYERRSALADALELQAIRHPSFSVAELADYIRDNSWTRSLDEQFSDPEDAEVGLGEESDASTYAASQVFGILEERRQILGEKYPFHIEESRVRFEGLRDSCLSYYLLLGITASHAYGIDIEGVDPRYYFEDLVTSCFGQMGLLAGNLGRVRRRVSSIGEAVGEIGELCKLTPQMGNALFRKRAQEEGVDVIAHLDWGDSRSVHWVFIIQATCGKSDTWSNKLGEPSPFIWKRALGLRTLPRPVLAVPHHMQRSTLHYLADRADGDRLLLDRLRLSNMNGELIDKADEICSMLEGIEIDFE